MGFKIVKFTDAVSKVLLKTPIVGRLVSAFAVLYFIINFLGSFKQSGDN